MQFFSYTGRFNKIGISTLSDTVVLLCNNLFKKYRTMAGNKPIGEILRCTYLLGQNKTQHTPHKRQERVRCITLTIIDFLRWRADSPPSHNDNVAPQWQRQRRLRQKILTARLSYRRRRRRFFGARRQLHEKVRIERDQLYYRDQWRNTPLHAASYVKRQRGGVSVDAPFARQGRERYEIRDEWRHRTSQCH